MKIHKKKKSVRLRGTNSGGHGSRKKWKGKGHHGGKGMAGTGKRADHKKSLVIKKYGNKYFGLQGETSRGTLRRKLKVINLGQIQRNFDSLMKKFGDKGVLDLSKYKILGNGILKEKVNVKALEFSSKAKEGIEKVGGSVVLVRGEDVEGGKVSEKKEVLESEDKE
ncbi:50S ribosomal protein L15 [archaeon]|jgi:large subunit ribosomal protein L15|nr:50S ribosomal protein L15 [archaeon]